MLQLGLFRIRTFSAAVSGSFFTRIGIGGVPFLLPLLYQVGLGLTPIQSGLLIMPQALAAMSTKFLMRRVLTRVGYRGVLISNTITLGLLLLLFATIGLRTPIWLIVLLAFCYGAFTSLQYTSMNTLVYADISDEQTSNASSIASTLQQMSISFGVATAGLATAFFIPDRYRSDPQRDDSRHSRGISRARRVHGSVQRHFRPAAKQRRQQRQSAQGHCRGLIAQPATRASGSDPLEDRGDALAAADAHGDQRVAAAGALQLVDRLDGEDRAGGADRVAERDAAAVRVDLGRIEAELRATAQACAAKASFDSITSMSPTLQAGALRAPPASPAPGRCP